MYPFRNYLQDARCNEEVFRNIIKSFPADFKEKQKLNPDSPLEEIFKNYSTGNRYGIWTILDFRVGPCNEPLAKLSQGEALFASEDIATLSGSGRVSKYKIGSDNSVEFDSNISVWMS